jgi:hypothetical protein
MKKLIGYRLPRTPYVRLGKPLILSRSLRYDHIINVS